jgi:hypothetical protein
MLKEITRPQEIAAELMFKKYDLHKREVHLHIQHFKNHVRNFQILFTLILSFGSYFFFKDEFKPSDNNKYFWLVSAFVVVTLSFFLLYDILHASFQIAVDSERMAQLERRINETLEEKLLVWESELVVLLHSDRLNPQFYLIGYALILFGLTVIVMPIVGAWYLWSILPADAIVFRSLSLVLVVFALGSMVWAIRVGIYVGMPLKLKRKAAEKIQKSSQCA